MLAPPPGAPPRPAALDRQLTEAVRARGPGYRPRTHHLEDGRPRFTNRLILERSPYLLQHAHNPVDWWPWGEAAFQEARRLGRPVFLSVGYSTCHWCHVMERESFEDDVIARVLNGRYLAIKVDREERPDVDQLYMTAVQLLTGGGGWPMSVWLTPEREPFFGGTYFPPRDGARHGMRGFLSILEEVVALYGADPERVRGATASLTAAIRTALAPAGPPARAVPGGEPIEQAVAQVRQRFDAEHGGLRGAPKFPSSLPVRLLLRHHRRRGDPRSLEMALTTLTRMAAGGIHDQVGGGFHRYSTDGRWLVPHFEKMLYDNALLALAYAVAWLVRAWPDLAGVVPTTLDYVLRELTSPEGGFCSATDADSEGEEGTFFTWTAAELRQVLGAEAERFCRFHGVEEAGNWEGVNVLHLPAPDEEEWAALAPARAALYARRATRPAPQRDDKILASWNGLMISALAFGGRILSEPPWVEAAARAADHVLSRMVKDGRLQRCWLDGQAGPPAYLDDHAFLAAGLLDLYEATFRPRWLEAALDLADRMERLFGDPAGGGWYTTAPDHEALLVREKPTHDGAEPSGASVAISVLLRLAAFTGDERWRAAAHAALRQLAPALAAAPLSLTETLLALDQTLEEVPEVVLVWPAGSPGPGPLLEVLRRTYLPSRALLGAPEGPELEALGAIAPPAAGKLALGGRPTAYVCVRGACRLPTDDPSRLAGLLAPARPETRS
jgi:uncharacterized protein YyaL (SSP411 family)